MMNQSTKVTLLNQITIPSIGFGTSDLRGDLAQRMVRAALEIGYRHIDTAQFYGNESEIGAAMKDSDILRNEVFLTTKVWIDRFREGDLQRSVEESLTRLLTDYVDLLLLHWPNPDVPLEETIGALNLAQDGGLTKSIGVSNFTADLMDEAVALSAHPLVMNQSELHPFWQPQSLLEGARAHGMVITAYAPLAQGRVFANETLISIGRKYGKTAGQVTLRWLLQQENVIAIPRSSLEAHAADNYRIFDFTLSASDMVAISNLTDENGSVMG